MSEWTEQDWARHDELREGMTIRAVRFPHWGNFMVVRECGKLYIENLTTSVLARKHARTDGVMPGWVVVK